MHHFHTATSMDDITGICHFIVKCYEERGYLEYRTWLTAIADGLVDSFDVLAVLISDHVDNSLHVTSGNFH